jgi:hypothetical protein
MSLFWLNDNLKLPFCKAEVQRTGYSEASFKFQRLRLEQPQLSFTSRPPWIAEAAAKPARSDQDPNVAGQARGSNNDESAALFAQVGFASVSEVSDLNTSGDPGTIAEGQEQSSAAGGVR